MGTRVVCMGQTAAADDGVGVAILDELRRRTLPGDTTLTQLADPMDLVSLLERGEQVVLVDAVLASPAGAILALMPEDLSTHAAQPASSHGMGAAQALELARALSLPCAAPHLRIIAVTIDRPTGYRVGLSQPVAAAVNEAAAHVLSLIEADHA